MRAHTMKPLTIKQKRFVNEYVKEGNGTQAALVAYNTDKPTVAGVIADENLKKPNIREAVDTALVALDLTPEWILNKHKNIAERHEVTDAMISERALENIGKIAGMYPSSTNSVELSDGKLSISWQN